MSNMIQALGFTSYREYLDSPLWKDKQSFILDKYPTCEKCKKARSSEVHHLTYENVGNEGKRDLLSVCRKCHKEIHGVKDVRDRP